MSAPRRVILFPGYRCINLAAREIVDRFVPVLKGKETKNVTAQITRVITRYIQQAIRESWTR